MILCDSNIFFQLFRGNQVIYEELEEIGFENLGISDVTIAEIYFGMKKSEEKQTKLLIRKFNRYYITKDCSKLFIEIISDLSSRQIGLPDALIGAIALSNSLPIYTLNIDDFKQIKGLKLYKPKRKFS